MHSAHNEGKSVVAERLIITLRNTICKYMTSISKNMYINKLDSIVNKHSNTYYSTMKIKSVDVKSRTYIDFDKKTNKEDPNFKVSDHVSLSKYKNIFARANVLNWSVEVFVIKKVKNTAPWTYVISDVKGKEIVEIFYEKESQKKNQEEFRIEKVIKRKDHKLYVNWKDFDNSFNSWIDKNILLYKNELFST